MSTQAIPHHNPIFRGVAERLLVISSGFGKKDDDSLDGPGGGEEGGSRKFWTRSKTKEQKGADEQVRKMMNF